MLANASSQDIPLANPFRSDPVNGLKIPLELGLTHYGIVGDSLHFDALFAARTCRDVRALPVSEILKCKFDRSQPALVMVSFLVDNLFKP